MRNGLSIMYARLVPNNKYCHILEQALQSSQQGGGVTLPHPAESFDWWSDSNLALCGSSGCWLVDVDNAPSVNLLTPAPPQFPAGA